MWATELGQKYNINNIKKKKEYINVPELFSENLIAFYLK